MIENRFVELLDELLELTEGGKVEWRETSNIDCFTALLKSGGVQIERFYRESDDDSPHAYYEATLLDSKSRPIQTMSIVPSANVSASLLHDLFEAARFKARGGANVLDELLTEVHGIANH